MRRFKLTRNTVKQWYRRFAVAGVGALQDLPRPGTARKYGAIFEKQVLDMIEQPAPKGRGRWTGKLVASALGVSKDAVARVLRANGIHLTHKRSWCVSKDPEFTQKAADVVGLYLNPPANAVMLSIDEKPSIQALERQKGFVPARKTVVPGQGSTDKRNGVANLFAALDVATGHVLAQTMQTRTRVDFLAFMDKVVASQPDGKEIHVVMDNLATHKRCDEWLAAHPQVKFHFTPTAASWLNQVEIGLHILTRQALDAASFQRLEQLVQGRCTSTPKNTTKPRARSNGASAKSGVRNSAIRSGTCAFKH